MTPDLQTAAIKATETLIRHQVTTAPVDPLRILKELPGVLVMSFESVSKEINQDRKCVLSMLGEKNQDAVTIVNLVDGKKQYLVTYNKMLSVNIFQRALAISITMPIISSPNSR